METNFTQPKRRLNLAQTLLICGVVFALYKIFQTEDLDKEIEKFLAKHGHKKEKL